MSRSRFVTLAISFLLAISTCQLANGQSQSAPPLADGITHAQSSMGLIDDLNLHSSHQDSSHHGESYTAAQASFHDHSNPPMPDDLDSDDLDSDDLDSDVREMTCQQCQQAIREADALVASLPTCEFCSHEMGDMEMTSELNVTHANQQIAKLLSITLASPSIDPATQDRVIEAALKMVAENSTLAANAKIAQLEADHALEIKQLNKQIAHFTEPNLSIPFVAFVEQQKKQGIKTFKMIGSNLRSKENSAKRELAEFRRSRALETIRLRQEIKALDQRIEELISYPNRPAHFLEPLYSPDQPLEPVIPPSQRPSSQSPRQMLRPHTSID